MHASVNHDLHPARPWPWASGQQLGDPVLQTREEAAMAPCALGKRTSARHFSIGHWGGTVFRGQGLSLGPICCKHKGQMEMLIASGSRLGHASDTAWGPDRTASVFDGTGCACGIAVVGSWLHPAEHKALDMPLLQDFRCCSATSQQPLSGKP